MDGKISNLAQVCSLRRYTLTEGSEKGLDILDCDNGKIRFLLNVSKALDISQLWHEGQNVSFLSKNGLTAREIPFLNRFEGGMLYTCGLDNVGGRDGFELHGTHHNTPAKVTKAECNEAGICVEAEIRETALFGKNLVFKRKVFVAIGSEELQITDMLENQGFAEENYCLLYHINVGYPMLDKGAKIIANIEKYTSRTEAAEKNAATRCEMSDCIVGQEELCYFLRMEQPALSLVNERLGKAFSLTWSKETLPYFLEWKSMASGDYALGLEPCTTELDERFAYKTLKAGERVSFSLSIKVHKI